MATTSPVHGGGEVVSRIVDALESTEVLPVIRVCPVDRTSLYRIADGIMSPITGPMGKEDYDSVLASKSILRHGTRWAWTIPISLPITDREAAALDCPNPSEVSGNAPRKAALVDDTSGAVFGVITVTDVFAWDKDAFILAVYGTPRKDHPGARLWTSDPRTILVGGDISLVPFADTRPFASKILTPVATRALLAERGYGASVAFQTRNPLHRAHEYALVHGAETLVRRVGERCRVGVFLNPLVGELKCDDVPAATRMETYDALISGKFLGHGDVDDELWASRHQCLADQVHLVGLDMRMFYGGPSEAVMHAIYRQNLGFTHFIIGRKHADVPFDDKTDIWGDFDAQQIFSSLVGSLAISTINVGFAAYFADIGRVGLVVDNVGKKSIGISGTKMRAMLNDGEKPDDRVMRPSTADILITYYHAKNAASSSNQ
jgi:sulfate adenylyltransferase